MRYRSDIDGLRAVAVLSVMAFHFAAPLPPEWRVPGGFTGVDVFFVISGYLITSQLYADVTSNRFSILAFYYRRVRRILPALLVMLVVTLAAGNWLLMPGDYKSLASSTIASALAISNHYFLENTGYFDRAADLAPLLHTWSLSVEEQFYIVWPVLLLLIGRRVSRKNLALTIAGLVIGLFLLSIAWSVYDRKQAFFIVAPRAWELLLGGLLVMMPRLKSPALANCATAIGLCMVSVGFFVVQPETFPGVSALYPTIGAALIVWPRNHEVLAAKLLGLLRPIGSISYSLYLWHWPIWVMFRWYINGAEPSGPETAAIALACFAVASLSFYFVERPFRAYSIRLPQALRTSAAAIIAVSMAGYFVLLNNGFPERVSERVAALSSLSKMWTWPCEMKNVDDRLPALCFIGATEEEPTTLLWGDSNAEHLAPLVAAAAKVAQRSVLMSPNCAPVINGTNLVYREINSYNDGCARFNSVISEYVASTPSLQNVILSASWKSFVDVVPGDWNENWLAFRTDLRLLVRRLVDSGKRVTIVKTVPHWPIADPVACALVETGIVRRQCDQSHRAIERSNYVQNNRHLSVFFEDLKKEFASLRLIDPASTMCPSAWCIAELNGEFLYRDAAHLRRNLSERTNLDLAKLLELDRALFRNDPTN